jgi:hypothetical protein
MMGWYKRLLFRPFFIRLMHWEYWSFSTVYFPIYIVWIALGVRARSFFFFAAANPSIRNGGFLNESKKEIYPLIPAGTHPATIFFSIPANGDIVMQQLKQHGLLFPLIGKPDIGGRGRGVKILMNEGDVLAYTRNAFMDFHIQEFVSYKNEVGIFYYRYPDSDSGKISGIVGKTFLSITGDGTSTLLHLIKNNKRAILQLPDLEKIVGGNFDRVVPDGEQVVLVPYGNHARGALFTDESALIDEGLEKMIDGLCKKIPGFYFGRLDIRFNTWEELKEGKAFSIIEVNGAGAEPTHIYDPGHSLFFAWKEIIRHWILLWRISRQNHKRGNPYLTVKQGLAMFREDKDWSQKLAAMPV